MALRTKGVFPILVTIRDIISPCASLRADADSFTLTGFIHGRSVFQPGCSGCQWTIEVVSEPRITPEGKAQADSKAQHTR